MVEVGKVYSSNRSGEFIVLQIIDKDKNRNLIYEVEFIKTKYKAYANSTQINKGHIVDKNYPTVVGVGYLGCHNKKDYPHEYSIWKSMLTRCYNKIHPTYERYGEKGVTVCQEWLCFENFIKDIKQIEEYNEKLFNEHLLQLDKDIKQMGSNNKVYSKDTCIWVTNYINCNFTNKLKEIIAISPSNESFTFTNVREFCRQNDLINSNVSDCLKGKRKQHKGWTFKFSDREEKGLYED